MKRLVMFILMLCVSLSLCFPSFADDTTPPPTETVTESEDSGPVSFIKAMIGVVFGNAIKTDTSESGTGSIFDPWEMLKNSTELALTTLEELTQSRLYSVLMSVGVVLLTMYFLLDLSTSDALNVATNGRAEAETLLQPFIKFIISLIFLCNTKWILYFIIALSHSAFNQALHVLTIENVVMGGDVADKLLAAMGYVANSSGVLAIFHNTTAIIMSFMVFVVPWLVSVVCNFLLVYVILSRVVKLVVQGVCAPVAMSDIYGRESVRSTHAWNFVKKYAGICFQSVVIVIVLYVVNSLIGTYSTQLVEGLNGAVNVGDMMNLGIQMAVLKVVQVGTVMGSAHEAENLFS